MSRKSSEIRVPVIDLRAILRCQPPGFQRRRNRNDKATAEASTKSANAADENNASSRGDDETDGREGLGKNYRGEKHISAPPVRDDTSMKKHEKEKESEENCPGGNVHSNGQSLKQAMNHPGSKRSGKDSSSEVILATPCSNNEGTSPSVAAETVETNVDSLRIGGSDDHVVAESRNQNIGDDKNDETKSQSHTSPSFEQKHGRDQVGSCGGDGDYPNSAKLRSSLAHQAGALHCVAPRRFDDDELPTKYNEEPSFALEDGIDTTVCQDTMDRRLFQDQQLAPPSSNSNHPSGEAANIVASLHHALFLSQVHTRLALQYQEEAVAAGKNTGQWSSDTANELRETLPSWLLEHAHLRFGRQCQLMANQQRLSPTVSPRTGRVQNAPPLAATLEPNGANYKASSTTETIEDGSADQDKLTTDTTGAEEEKAMEPTTELPNEDTEVKGTATENIKETREDPRGKEPPEDDTVTEAEKRKHSPEDASESFAHSADTVTYLGSHAVDKKETQSEENIVEMPIMVESPAGGVETPEEQYQADVLEPATSVEEQEKPKACKKRKNALEDTDMAKTKVPRRTRSARSKSSLMLEQGERQKGEEPTKTIARKRSTRRKASPEEEEPENDESLKTPSAKTRGRAGVAARSSATKRTRGTVATSACSVSRSQSGTEKSSRYAEEEQKKNAETTAANNIADDEEIIASGKRPRGKEAAAADDDDKHEQAREKIIGTTSAENKLEKRDEATRGKGDGDCPKRAKNTRCGREEPKCFDDEDELPAPDESEHSPTVGKESIELDMAEIHPSGMDVDGTEVNGSSPQGSAFSDTRLASQTTTTQTNRNRDIPPNSQTQPQPHWSQMQPLQKEEYPLYLFLRGLWLDGANPLHLFPPCRSFTTHCCGVCAFYNHSNTWRHERDLQNHDGMLFLIQWTEAGSIVSVKAALEAMFDRMRVPQGFRCCVKQAVSKICGGHCGLKSHSGDCAYSYP